MSMRERRSPNFDARNGAVRFVVLHYTGMQDAETALKRLCDPAPQAGAYPGPWQAADTPPEQPLSRVSAHYLVAGDGVTWELVPEAARAWHAGAGAWAGSTTLNDHSIGVEIVNGGHDFGLPPYPEAQIEAVIALLRAVLARHGLPPQAVIAHSDLAPARKQDPGEHFPWRRLAQAGVSIWPPAEPQAGRLPIGAGAQGEPVAHLQRLLAQFGYALEASGRFDAHTELVVKAFQRRFLPERVDGVADGPVVQALSGLLGRVIAPDAP